MVKSESSHLERLFSPTYDCELETGHKYIKVQFFWGAKGSKTPRAIVLWPT